MQDSVTMQGLSAHFDPLHSHFSLGYSTSLKLHSRHRTLPPSCFFETALKSTASSNCRCSFTPDVPMNTGSFLTYLRSCVRPPLCVLGCVTFAGYQAPYAALLLHNVSSISRFPSSTPQSILPNHCLLPCVTSFSSSGS